MPDPGWDFHVGKAGAATALDAVADKVQEWPTAVSAAVIGDLVGGQAFDQWYTRPQGRFPVALLDAEGQAAIQAKTAVVNLSGETALKQLARHPDLAATEYAYAQQAIDLGRRIKDGERSLVFVLEADQGYVTVVKATREGNEVYLVSFRRLPTDEARRDQEIARLMRKGEKK